MENIFSANSGEVRQLFEVNHLEEMYEPLLELENLRLKNRFILKRVINLGGQSIFWLTEDSRHLNLPLITRMALLPYHRIAYLGYDKIQQARERILYDAHILKKFKNSAFPNLVSIVTDVNPLFKGRERKIYYNEVYLITELIIGKTLLAFARDYHRQNEIFPLSRVIEKAVLTFAELSILLENQGLLYSDVSPRNFMVSQNYPEFYIRVVDPGSVISVDLLKQEKVPITLDYVPPKIYEQFKDEKPVQIRREDVIYAFGKMLWQLITNRQPIPGIEPDLSFLNSTATSEEAELVSKCVNCCIKSFQNLRVR